jgi:hypothetical protein
MKSLFYVFTILGGLLGMAILFISIMADSAPQQGAGAAVAVALVVIPYCMARSFEKAGQESLAKTLERLVPPSQKVAQYAQARPDVMASAPHPKPTEQNPYAPTGNRNPITNR